RDRRPAAGRGRPPGPYVGHTPDSALLGSCKNGPGSSATPRAPPRPQAAPTLWPEHFARHAGPHPVGNVRRKPASATSPGTLARPLRSVLSPHREQGDTSRSEECSADQGRGFLLARRNRTVHGTNVGGSQDSCACLSCLEQRSLDRGKLREGGQPGSA